MIKNIDGVSEQFFDDGTEPRPFVPADQARVGIIPVPLEKTVSYLGGTLEAPDYVLDASRQVELFDPEFNSSPYLAGIHTYPAVDCSGRTEHVLFLIRARIESLSSSGQIPVCLGGEHTLTIAPVSELLNNHPALTVLHLDAHADLRESYGGSRLSHACVMRRIHEIGVPTVSVGVRSLSKEEAQYINKNDMAIYSGWEFGERGYPWKEIVAKLSEEVYITVDLDVFDPSEVPDVGTPEPGGLRWHDALNLFRTLRNSGRKIVGFDLVELCPKTDSVVSPFFTARLLYKMIGFFCRG